MNFQRFRHTSARRLGGDRGFSLTETIVASAILVTGLVSVAQLFIVSTDANRSARRVTAATVLAQQKIEQLRGLTWGYDPFGLPVSDFTTNIAVTPPQPSGGFGLQASPGGALDTATTGYCDYLSAYGEWLGSGTTPPSGSVYVRRWSVEPLPTNPNNTLVFQVVVERLVQATTSGGSGAPPSDAARLVSLKTRKSI